MYVLDELHVDLKATLVCDYLDQSVDDGRTAKRFKVKAEKFLKTPGERSFKAPGDIFGELERKGHIKPGRYEKLIELVDDDARIMGVIKETQRKIGLINEGMILKMYWK